VAFNSTAVPYTLDGAGILIKHKRVDYVAELAEIVAHKTELRKKIIQGQRQRLERFKREQEKKFLFQNIENLLRQK
jgi:hypothetical protein